MPWQKIDATATKKQLQYCIALFDDKFMTVDGERKKLSATYTERSGATPVQADLYRLSLYTPPKGKKPTIVVGFYKTLKTPNGKPTSTPGNNVNPTRRFWAVSVGFTGKAAAVYPIVKDRVKSFFEFELNHGPGPLKEKLVIIDDADRVIPTPKPEIDKLFDEMQKDKDVVLKPAPNEQAYGAYRQHLKKRLNRPNPTLTITEITPKKWP